MEHVVNRVAIARRSSGLLPAAVIGSLIAYGSWGALAQTAPNPQTTPAAPAQSSKPKADPEQVVICKYEEATGTRLGGHKICHTRAEWRQMAHDSADYLNDNHRNVCTDPAACPH